MHTRLVNEKVKPFVAKQLKTVVRSELDTSLEGKTTRLVSKRKKPLLKSERFHHQLLFTYELNSDNCALIFSG